MFAITNAKPYVPAVNLSTFVLSFTDGTQETSHIFPTVEKLDCIFIIDARPFFGPQVKNIIRIYFKKSNNQCNLYIKCRVLDYSCFEENYTLIEMNNHKCHNYNK